MTATTLGFGILLVGPAGGEITLSPYTDDFFSRLVLRYTPDEAAKLLQVECYEAAISSIPSGSTITVSAGDDQYSLQRITEIAYPRLDVAERASGSDYVVHVTESPLSGSGDVIVEQHCGNRIVTVVRR